MNSKNYTYEKSLDPYSIGILDRQNKKNNEKDFHIRLDPYSIGILDRLNKKKG